MKLLGLFLIFSLLGLQEASQVNQAVEKAARLYQQGHYREAADLYQYLYDSLEVRDPSLVLNLAHAAFQAGDNTRATLNYTLLSKNTDQGLQSIAFTQLGLLYFRKENPERALYTLKKALIQDPRNENARYNYELVKKYLAANPALTKKPKQKQQQPAGKEPQSETGETNTRPAAEGREGSTRDNQKAGDNAPVNRPDATGQDNQGGSDAGHAQQSQPGAPARPQPSPQGQLGDQESGLSPEASPENGPGSLNKREEGQKLAEQERQIQTLRARLKKADLAPEKALQLLEAIRNAELQYLQQVPRKSQKSRNQNKPDW